MQRIKRSSDVPITEKQKKALGNWMLVRYLGIGLGLLAPAILLGEAVNVLFHIRPMDPWTLPLLVLSVVLLLVGSYAHWQIRKLPWWCPPPKTEVEKIREEYEEKRSRLWMPMTMISFAVFTFFSTHIVWFLLVVPVAVGHWYILLQTMDRLEEQLKTEE